jgi:hypothetical protein
MHSIERVTFGKLPSLCYRHSTTATFFPDAVLYSTRFVTLLTYIYQTVLLGNRTLVEESTKSRLTLETKRKRTSTTGRNTANNSRIVDTVCTYYLLLPPFNMGYLL